MQLWRVPGLSAIAHGRADRGNDEVDRSGSIGRGADGSHTMFGREASRSGRHEASTQEQAPTNGGRPLAVQTARSSLVPLVFPQFRGADDPGDTGKGPQGFGIDAQSHLGLHFPCRLPRCFCTWRRVVGTAGQQARASVRLSPTMRGSESSRVRRQAAF